jgi:hypothetical protein
MSSYVDILRESIELQISEAGKGLGELQKYGPPVIERLVRIYLEAIPLGELAAGEVSRILIAELMGAIDLGQEAVAKFAKAAEGLGSPDALRAAAASIGEGVDSASDKLGLTMTDEALQAIFASSWNGDASERYAAAFHGQQPAIPIVSKHGSVLAQVLNSLADGIELYYVELLAAGLTLLAGVIGCVVAICSAAAIVTIPFSAAALVASLVAVVAGIIGLIVIFVTLSQQMNDDVAALKMDAQVWPSGGFRA